MSHVGPGRPRILMMSLHGYVAAQPELGLPDTGGQVVFVLELAKHFRDLGHAVDIVTRRFEDQPEYDDMGPDLRVWRVPFGGPSFVRKEDMHDHLDEFARRFIDALADQKIGYEYISSHYWDAGYAAQTISEEFGIAHIHTPHSLGSWKRKDMAGDRGDIESNYRFEERVRKEFLIYRRCDRVIATTNQQVEILQGDYEVPESHIVMIPPGIDEGRYTPITESETGGLRRRLKFRKHDVYTVGRAAANKGYDLLIRALPELRELIPDARIQMAVGANSRDDQKRIDKWQKLTRQLGVGDQVLWHGHIEDAEMPSYYRAAPVFALPSRYEPFGMTAVEAMACGTPCVVTVHGGLEEMFDFGSHALFADPQRPREFAVMLSMPLRYPQLSRRLSVDGARFARRMFGWRGIAKRTLAVLDSARAQHDRFVVDSS